MPKIDPYKFVLKEKDEVKLRPGMSGVYYEGGYAYATDAYSLLKIKADYPRKLEGKVVGKDGKVVKEQNPNTKKKQLLEVGPPKYNKVIPNQSDYTEYTVNVADLESAVNKLKDRYSSYMKSKPGKWHSEAPSPWVILAPKGTRRTDIEVADISLRHETDGTPGVAAFDMDVLKKIVYFMKSEKTDKIYMHKTKSQNRAMIAKSDNGIALAMPVYIEDQEKRNGAYMVWITPTGSRKNNQTEQKKQTKQPKTDTTMKKTTRKSTRKAAATMKTASSILKSQKKDYQAIFRAEVKKSKSPNEGAKKAGKIYRERYGSTATARWKRALQRAK